MPHFTQKEQMPSKPLGRIGRGKAYPEALFFCPCFELVLWPSKWYRLPTVLLLKEGSPRAQAQGTKPQRRERTRKKAAVKRVGGLPRPEESTLAATAPEPSKAAVPQVPARRVPSAGPNAEGQASPRTPQKVSERWSVPVPQPGTMWSQ